MEFSGQYLLGAISVRGPNAATPTLKTKLDNTARSRNKARNGQHCEAPLFLDAAMSAP